MTNRTFVSAIYRHYYFLFIVFILFNDNVAESRLLSSTEQALGRWLVTINKKDPTLFDSMIFPNQSVSESPSDTCSSNGYNVLSTLQMKKEYSSLQCILSVEKNGEFILRPLIPSNNPTNLNLNEEMTDPIPLRGQWNLESTCYCVTDRHYDNFSMIAFPRARLWKQRRSINFSTKESITALERANIELRCKIWGRYGSQVVRQLLGYRQNRGRSRMTHGTILGVRSGSRSILSSPKWFWWKRRIILGTFSAKAIPSRWETEFDRIYFENINGVPGEWLFKNKRWVFVEER